MFNNFTFKRNVKATLRNIWSKIVSLQGQAHEATDNYAEHEARFAGHASLFTSMSKRIQTLADSNNNTRAELRTLQKLLGPIWTTKSGHVVTPKFMADDHIERMLRSNFPGSEMRHGLELERDRREENAKWEAQALRPVTPVEARLDHHTKVLKAVGEDIEKLQDAKSEQRRTNKYLTERGNIARDDRQQIERKLGGRINQLEARVIAARNDRHIRAKKANERIDELQREVSQWMTEKRTGDKPYGIYKGNTETGPYTSKEECAVYFTDSRHVAQPEPPAPVKLVATTRPERTDKDKLQLNLILINLAALQSMLGLGDHRRIQLDRIEGHVKSMLHPDD
jgi:DNA repair exonuclease SbcCD ATPase subunit